MLDHIIATEEAKEGGDGSPDEEFDFEKALRDDPSPERAAARGLGTNIGYQPVLK